MILSNIFSQLRNSKDLKYNPSGSNGKLTSKNVQAAIDEMATKINNPNGLASLDNTGKLRPDQVPNMALNNSIVTDEYSTIEEFADAVASGDVTITKGDCVTLAIVDSSTNDDNRKYRETYMLMDGDGTSASQYIQIQVVDSLSSSTHYALSDQIAGSALKVKVTPDGNTDTDGTSRRILFADDNGDTDVSVMASMPTINEYGIIESKLSYNETSGSYRPIIDVTAGTGTNAEVLSITNHGYRDCAIFYNYGDSGIVIYHHPQSGTYPAIDITCANPSTGVYISNASTGDFVGVNINLCTDKVETRGTNTVCGIHISNSSTVSPSCTINGIHIDNSTIGDTLEGDNGVYVHNTGAGRGTGVYIENDYDDESNSDQTGISIHNNTGYSCMSLDNNGEYGIIINNTHDGSTGLRVVASSDVTLCGYSYESDSYDSSCTVGVLRGENSCGISLHTVGDDSYCSVFNVLGSDSYGLYINGTDSSSQGIYSKLGNYMAALTLGESGSIASGNTNAVVGGTVYDHINAFAHQWVDSSGVTRLSSIQLAHNNGDGTIQYGCKVSFNDLNHTFIDASTEYLRFRVGNSSIGISNSGITCDLGYIGRFEGYPIKYINGNMGGAGYLANFIPHVDDSGILQSSWRIDFRYNLVSDYAARIYAESDYLVLDATTGVRAVSYLQSSDRRLKNHNQYIDPHTATSIIQSLKPVSYRFDETKVNGNSKLHYGYYAQDVEEVLIDNNIDPTDVNIIMKNKSENFDDGEYALVYDEFIPILTSGMQDVYSHIEELETKVSQLEESNNDLQNRVSQLEQMIKLLIE